MKRQAKQSVRARWAQRKRALLTSLAAAAMVMAGVPMPARAVDTWNGSVDATWDQGANWSLTAEPLSTDDVTFPFVIPGTGSTITLTAGELANSLLFLNNYTLTGGDLTLTSGQIRVGNALVANINSQLLGTAGLNFAGTAQFGRGVLYLNNATNSYVGTNTISGGTLVIGSNGALGNSANDVVITSSATRGDGGGALIINGGLSGGLNISRNINLSGRGPANDGTGLINIGNNSITGTLTTAAGSNNTSLNSAFGLLTIGNMFVNGTAVTTFTSFGTSNSNSIGNITVTGTLAGTGSIEKTGQSSTLLLDPSDTTGYTGTIRISQGSLRIGSGAALGVNAGATTSSTIDLNGGILEARSDVSFNTGRTSYLRTNSSIFVDHTGTGTAINQTISSGTYTYDHSETLTLNGRNGYGVSFSGTNLQTGTNGNYTIANNLNGLLSIAGNFWNLNNAGSRTFNFTGNGNTVISGNVLQGSNTAASNNLTKTGTGTLSITSTGGTIKGNINVNQGTLAIASFNSINNNTGTAATAVNPASTINLGNGSTAGTLSIVGNNIAAAQLSSVRAINLAGTTGNGTINASQTGTSGALVLSVVNSTGTSGTRTLVLGGTNTLDNLISGSISNGGGTTILAKADSGTWALSGTNSYTGGTAIAGGTLKVLSNDPITGQSTVIADTGALSFNNNAATGFSGGIFQFNGSSGVNSTETLASLVGTSGAGAVRLIGSGGSSANLVFSAVGTTAAGTGINFDTSAANSGTITITGAPANTATSLQGSGRYYFNGADFVDAVGGVLAAPTYTVGGAIYNDSSTSAFTAGRHTTIVNSTKTNAAVAISSLKLSGNNTLTMTGLLTTNLGGGGNPGTILATGGTSTIAGTGVSTGGSGDLVIRVNNASDVLNLNAPITATSTGGFTKNGLGTLVIGGVNAGTGTVTINEGTVRMSGASTAKLSPNNQPVVIRQGGTLDLFGTSSVANSTAIASISGAGTITNSNSSAAAVLQVGNNNGSGSFLGTINNGAGGLRLTKVGTGALTLSGQNTFTGVVTVGSTGLIQAMNLSNIGSNSAIGRGVAGSDALNAASLVMNGTTGGLSYQGLVSVSTDRLFTFNGSAANSGGRLENNAANNSTLVFSNSGSLAFGTSSTVAQLLTLGGASTGDNIFNPAIIDNGALKTSLNKTGAGNWVLTGSNTYTGTTTVTQGVLQANDIFSNGGSIGLSSGSGLVLGGTSGNAVFQSSGQFNRTLTTSGNAGAGTVSFGSGVTTGAVGFSASGSKLVVDLGNNAGNGFASQTLMWADALSGGFLVNAASTASTIFLLNSSTALSELEIRNNIDLNGGNRTIQVDDNTSTFTDMAMITGVISNSVGTAVANLTKSGSGVLELLGANTYDGVTSVTAGTLVVNSLGSTGGGATSVGSALNASSTGSAVTLGSGSTGAAVLNYIGSGETSDRLIRLNTTTGSVQLIADGSGALVISGVRNDMVSGSKTLFLRGSNNLANTLNGGLSDNNLGTALAVLSVTHDSGGTWILDGVNSHSGNTTASAGLLGIGNDSALGSGTLVVSNGTIFANGGDRNISNTFQHNNNAVAAFVGDYSFTFNGSWNDVSAGNSHTLTNNIANGKLLTINGPMNFNSITAARTLTINGSGDTIINGVMSSTTNFAENITYTGTGSLTLGAAGNLNNSGNLYSGDTTITSGTVKMAANNTLPSFMSNSNVTNTVGTLLTMNSNTDVQGLVVGQTVTGPNIAPGTVISSIGTATGGGANTVGLSIAPTSDLVGGEQLFFSRGNVVMNASTATNIMAILDMNGTNQIINGLTATTGGTLNVIKNSTTTPSVLTLGNFNKATNYNGTFEENSTGTIGLTKVGTANAVFGGVNNLTGPINVQGGLLKFSTPLTNAGSVSSITVAAGATLSFRDGVANPIANLTNLNLGDNTLDPSFDTANLELEAGDLNAVGDNLNTDVLTVLVPPTFANKIKFNISDNGLSAATRYTLIESSGNDFTGLATYIANVSGFAGSTIMTDINGKLDLLTGTLVSGDMFWTGATDNTWNAVDEFSNGLNWSSDLAGATMSTTTPGSGTTVVFNAESYANGNFTATLEQNFKINALRFQTNATTPSNTPDSLTIAPGGNPLNTLTIAPSSSSDGIAVNTHGTDTAPLNVIISAPLRMGADQTWTVADADQLLTISGGVSGTADLTTDGLGTVLISGASTYVGDTTINGGVLKAGATTALVAGNAYIVNSGAQLQINGFSNAIGSLSGSGSVSNSGTANATLTLGANNSSSLFEGTISNSTNTNTSTLAITKLGTGNLTLTGVNTQTGTTTVGAANGINAGSVVLSSSTATISGNAGLTIFGGTVDIMDATGQSFSSIALGGGNSTSSATLNSINAIDLRGNVTFNATNNAQAALINNSLNSTASRSITVGNSSNAATDLTINGSLNNTGTGTVTWTVAGTGNLLINGQISNGGTTTSALTVTSNGTTTLTGANTQTGTTTLGTAAAVNFGLLRLQDGLNNSISGNGALTIFGGTVDLGTTTSQIVAATALGGGASASNAPTILGSGMLDLRGTLTFNATNNAPGGFIQPRITTTANRVFAIGDSNIAATDLTLDGGLQTTTTGTITFTGAGNVQINNGLADLATELSIVKTNTGTMTISGGNTMTGNWQIGANNAAGGVVFLAAGGTTPLTPDGSLTLFGGAVHMNDNSALLTSLTVGGSQAGTFANITGTSTLDVRGNITYNASNNNLGSTINPNILLDASRVITVGNSTNAVMDLAFTGNISQTSTAATTLTITGSGSSLISGNVAEVGGTSMNLTKISNGNLTLSGNNTLTGNTRVDGGVGAVNSFGPGSLNLDFTTNNGNKLSDAGTVDLRGGTLRMIGNNDSASVENVGQLLINSSTIGNRVIVDNGTNATAQLIFGNPTINRGQGDVIDFSGTGTITISSGVNVNGIIGGFATRDGVDFAAYDGSSNVVAFSGYQTGTVADDWVATDNVKVAAPLTQPTMANTINSLVMAFADPPNPLNLPATGLGLTNNTLRIQSGGVIGFDSAAITGGRITTTNSGNDLIVNVATGSIFTIGSILDNDGSNARGLTKSGTGQLVLTGLNGYTGNTEIVTGTLSMGAAKVFGSNPFQTTTLIVRSGAGLLMNDFNQTFNQLTSDGAADATIDTGILNTTTLRSLASGNNTFNGVISGQGNFEKFTSASATNSFLTIQRAQTYAGSTLIDGNGIATSGILLGVGSTTGSFDNSTSITLRNGGLLRLDNNRSANSANGQNNNNRINNAAQINIAGGTFELLGAANATTTESVGTVNLSGGAANLIVRSGYSTNTITERLATLAIASQIRSIGGTVNYVGTGSTSNDTITNPLGNLSTANLGPRITFGTAPTLSNGIIGGFATVNGGIAGVDADFATIDTNGVRAFTAYDNDTLAVPATSADNFQITADAAALNSVTGNSLKIAGGGAARTISFNSAQTLTLLSGGILAAGSTTNDSVLITATDGPSAITAGDGVSNAELFAYVNVNNSLTLGSNIGITDNGSATTTLVKTGAGALILNGASTYTGSTIVNEGAIVVGAANQTSNDWVFNGGAIRLSAGTADSTDFTGKNLIVNANATLDVSRSGNAATTYTLSGLTMNNEAALNVTRSTITGANNGTLFINGAATLNSDARLDAATNTVLDLGQGLTQGAFNLTKTGAGTLALSSGNVGTGNWYLNAGNTQLNDLTGLGTGTVHLNGGALITRNDLGGSVGNNLVLMANGTLQVGRSTNAAGDITNTYGSLSVDGSRTLTVSSANMDNNSIAIAAVSAIALEDFTTGTFNVRGNTANNQNTVLSVADGIHGKVANLALTGTGLGLLAASGTSTYTGTTTVDSVTLALLGTHNGGGNYTVNSNGNVNIQGTGVLNLAANAGIALNGTATSSGTMTNNGIVNVSGTGVVNVNSGGVLINQATGNLAMTGVSALNVNTGGVFNNVGTLTNGGTGLLNITGTTTNNGTMITNAVVGSGGLLKGTGTITGTVDVDAGGTFAPGTSPGNATVGVLNFNSGSIYNWEHIAGNALGVSGTDFDHIDVTTSGTIAAGAKIDLNYDSATDFTNSFWNSNQSWAIIDAVVSMTGTFADGDIQIFVNSVLTGAANTIAGEGHFTTSLTGTTLNLNWVADSVVGSGNFWAPNATGGHDGATLWTSSSSVWAATSGVQGTSAQAASGVLHFTDNSGTVTVSGTVSSIDGLTFESNGYVLTGGQIDLTNAGSNGINVEPGMTTRISSSLNATNNVTKTGTGTLILDGANTIGGLNINAGVVNARSNGALGNFPFGVFVSSGAALELEGGITTTSGQLDLAGNGIGSGALRNVSGDNNYTGSIVLDADTTIQSDADTLTLSGASISGFLSNKSLTVTGAGNTTISSNINIGSGNLTKDGNGVLSVTGSNDYTGNTTINGGNLKMNGTHSTAGDYLVNNGGTLSGTGTIFFDSGKSLTVALGGTLAPGNSPGTLTVTNPATINGTHHTQLDNNSISLLSVINGFANGDVNLGGSSTASFAATGTQTAGRYTFIGYQGARTGTFAIESGVPSGYRVAYDTALGTTKGGADPNTIQLVALAQGVINTVTAVPAASQIIVGGSTNIAAAMNVSNNGLVGGDPILSQTLNSTHPFAPGSATDNTLILGGGNHGSNANFLFTGNSAGSFAGTVAGTFKAYDANGNVVDSAPSNAVYNIDVLDHADGSALVISGDNQTVIVGANLTANVRVQNNGGFRAGLQVNANPSLTVGLLNPLAAQLIPANSLVDYTAGWTVGTAGLGQINTASFIAGDDQSLNGASPLGLLQANITYNVLDHALGSALVTAGDNQTVIIGATINANVEVANAAGLRADLQVQNMGLSGGGSLLPGGTQFIAPAGSQNYAASFVAGSIGLGQINTAQYNAGDDQFLLGANPLAPLTADITYNVIGHSSGSAAVTAGNNQTVIVGFGGNTNANINVANAAGPLAALQVDANPTIANGALVPAAAQLIAAGNSVDYTATLGNFNVVGVRNDQATFVAGDDQTLLGANPLGNLIATVTTNVLDHAAGSAAVTVGNNQTVIVGANLASTINVANAAGFRAGLEVAANPTLTTGILNPLAAQLIAAGNSVNYNANFNAAVVGLGQINTASFVAGDDQTLLGANALAPLAANITYNVLDHAAGSASVIAGNNQTVIQGANINATVEVANAAGIRSDLETHTVGLSGGGSLLPGGIQFIAAGGAQNYAASFVAGSIGLGQINTAVFNAGDDQSLLGANPLAPLTTDITFNVVGHSSGSAAVTAGNNQTVIVGFGGNTNSTINVANAAGPLAGLQVNANPTIANGALAPAAAQLIAAGNSVDYTATLGNFNAVGVRNDQANFTAGDDQTLAGANPLGNLVATVTTNVLDHASASTSVTNNNFVGIVGGNITNVVVNLSNAAGFRAGLEVNNAATIDVGSIAGPGSTFLTPGSSQAYTTNFALATVGNFTANSNHSGLSDDTSILGATPLAPVSATISGVVLDHSNGSFDSAIDDNGTKLIDFGLVFTGGTLSQNFDIHNLASIFGALFTADLKLVGFTEVSDVDNKFDLTGFINGLLIGAGDSHTLGMNFDRSMAGSFSADYILFTADQDLPGATNGAQMTIHVQGIVSPIPEPSSLALLGLAGLAMIRRRRSR